MPDDLNTLLSEMDNLWSNFTNCRAHFPTLDKNLIGQTKITSRLYYVKSGFNVTLFFNQPIDQQKLNKMHSIGHWINQNFIIRLSALMESYQIYSKKIKIDYNLDGSHLTNIVRRLRNSFAHSSGRFNPRSHKDVEILKLMNEHLGLNKKVENRTEFPLDIDIILKRLFKGCKKYVEEKIRIVEQANTVDSL
jgi:hypothetical protein